MAEYLGPDDRPNLDERAEWKPRMPDRSPENLARRLEGTRAALAEIQQEYDSVLAQLESRRGIGGLLSQLFSWKYRELRQELKLYNGCLVDARNDITDIERIIRKQD